MAENYLDRIVRDKHANLEVAKRTVSLEALRKRIANQAAPLDFTGPFRSDGVAVIGELKRVSPAKGVLGEAADPAAVALAYATGGIAAISVLTEERHFKGSIQDLVLVREALANAGLIRPLLRKDFVFDPYQVVEARAYGADAVLIIVAIIESDDLLRTLIQDIEAEGMTALVEVNDEIEVARAIAAGATFVGVNNRNLRTFDVTLATTERLRPLFPETTVVLSLSGISTRADIERVRAAGVQGVLVGEALMRSADPAATTAELVAWGQS